MSKDDIGRPLEALNRMLDVDDGRFPDDSWYPLEPVELVTFTPDHPAYVPCIALLLLDFLRDGHHADDGQDALKSRWSIGGAEICALNKEVRQPLLRAFRYMYETDRHASDAWLWRDRRVRRRPVAIPWLPPQGAV